MLGEAHGSGDDGDHEVMAARHRPNPKDQQDLRHHQSRDRSLGRRRRHQAPLQAHRSLRLLVLMLVFR